MTTLNGLGAEEVVRAHGSWPIVSAVTFMSRDEALGHARSSTSSTPRPGWAPTRTPRTPWSRRSQTCSRRSGLKVEAMPDLRPAQWSKLIFNATVNAVAALTGLPHDPHFAAQERPSDLGHLVHDLMDEGKAVASAAGIELHDDPWEMNVLATRRGSAHYPSMLEDVEAQRPTEIDLITGALVREAGRHGVEAPLHTAMYRLVKAKEESW